MCVWGPAQLYDLIKLNNVFYLCEFACVWGLFRYLTQLPPSPPLHTREVIVNIKGGGGYSSGSVYTVFSSTSLGPITVYSDKSSVM